MTRDEQTQLRLRLLRAHPHITSVSVRTDPDTGRRYLAAGVTGSGAPAVFEGYEVRARPAVVASYAVLRPRQADTVLP